MENTWKKNKNRNYPLDCAKEINGAYDQFHALDSKSLFFLHTTFTLFKLLYVFVSWINCFPCFHFLILIIPYYQIHPEYFTLSNTSITNIESWVVFFLYVQWLEFSVMIFFFIVMRFIIIFSYIVVLFSSTLVLGVVVMVFFFLIWFHLQMFLWYLIICLNKEQFLNLHIPMFGMLLYCLYDLCCYASLTYFLNFTGVVDPLIGIT